MTQSQRPFMIEKSMKQQTEDNDDEEETDPLSVMADGSIMKVKVKLLRLDKPAVDLNNQNQDAICFESKQIVPEHMCPTKLWEYTSTRVQVQNSECILLEFTLENVHEYCRAHQDLEWPRTNNIEQ